MDFGRNDHAKILYSRDSNKFLYWSKWLFDTLNIMPPASPQGLSLRRCLKEVPSDFVKVQYIFYYYKK